MKTTEFLENSQVKYETTTHRAAFTAQRMAALEHVKGQYVAKPVIVKADGKFLMCVLAACNKIDFDALRRQIGASKVELADEDEIAKIFTDCEIGAEPPFGNLYGLTTIMDKSLEKDDHILFQADSHERGVRMKMADYLRLAKPKVLEFSYQMT